jgi:hypothetical protein
MCRAVPDAPETTVGHRGTWEGCILQRDTAFDNFPKLLESQRRDLSVLDRTDPEPPSLLYK